MLACFAPPLIAHLFTWFNGYHHAWLERERSRYIWGIMNIHAQVMAHMMRAVLSNSLAEDKTSVMEAVKHSPISCSNTQAREKRQNSYVCLTSNLTAMTRSSRAVFHLPELDSHQNPRVPGAYYEHVAGCLSPLLKNPSPSLPQHVRKDFSYQLTELCFPNPLHPLNIQALCCSHQQTLTTNSSRYS